MNVTVNVREFLGDLNKVSQEEVPALVSVATRKVGMETFGRLVEKSPVDTGRFRGSWTLAADAPDTSVAPEGLNIPAPRTPDVDVKPFGSVFINNELPYAQRLNEGWSDQAPAFFVEQTISEVTRIPLDRLTGGE